MITPESGYTSEISNDTYEDFLYACRDNEIDKVIAHITRYPTILYESNCAGLFVAYEHDNREIINIYIDKRVQYKHHILDNYGIIELVITGIWSSFIDTCKDGPIDDVKYFMESYYLSNNALFDGYCNACYRKDMVAAYYIINNGLGDYMDTMIDTPEYAKHINIMFGWLCGGGHMGEVQFYTEEFTSMLDYNHHNCECLIRAVENKQYDIVRYLYSMHRQFDWNDGMSEPENMAFVAAYELHDLAMCDIIMTYDPDYCNIANARKYSYRNDYNKTIYHAYREKI